MKSVLVVPVEPFLMGDLTGLEMRVLGIMIAHADERGRCWPGQLGIAEKIGSDRGRVTKTITSLRKKEIIAKDKRGRANAYQISSRFLVVAQAARRPARKDDPSQQPSMLLPITTGAKPAPIGGPHKPTTGAKPALIPSGEEARPIGVNPTPTGAKPTPGRESMKKINSKSSTESGAARGDDEENRGDGSLARCARPGAGTRSERVTGGESVARQRDRGALSAGESPDRRGLSRPTDRPLPPAVDDAARRDNAPERRMAWLSTLGQFVGDTRPAELERFWLEAMKPPAEARKYLNEVDAAMRASGWYRARRARRRSAALSAGDQVRSPAPERLSKGPSDARVFRHVLDTMPEAQAWELLARVAAGDADGKAAITTARRQLVAQRARKAADAVGAGAAKPAARRRARA
jgi:hypothetical protein